MKKSYTRVIAAAIALLLVFGFLFSMFAEVIFVTTYGVDNQTKLASLQEQLAAAKAATAEIQKKVNSLSNSKSVQLEKKEAIEKQMDATQNEIDLTEQMIVELTGKIEQSEANLAVAKAQEQEQYELFKNRVRASYERDNTSTLELIFTASSFTEIFTHLEYAQDIAAYDKKIMTNLTNTRKYIEELKLELETDREEQEKMKVELNKKHVQLLAQSQEIDRLINDLTQQIKEQSLDLAAKKKIQAQYQAETDAIAAEIRAASARSKSYSSKYNGGTMKWPIPGYYKISSDYSMRNHPITGTYSQHTGIDIPAPKGTKIKAAADGKVLTVGYNTAYGKRVIVDHGGGVTTLYAHMSEYNVKVGQVVAAGDVVGFVGSTGYSTGNHLHFSVLENGSYVSPWNYVSK